MKKTTFALLALLILCFGCNEKDDPINPDKEKEEDTTTSPEYLRTIDLSSYVSENLLVDDFDVEDGYLYFNYGNNIYRNNLSSETNTLESIIENSEDWIETLKVIGNNLYYQEAYAWGASDINQINLNAISEGVQTSYEIIGKSRAQLGKNGNKLYYVSSINALSPINNFHEFNPSDTDPLIVTDEFIFPKNLRWVENYIYFSSQKDIRRFDLNNPTAASSIVYTVPNTVKYNDIKGFDILDNVVYYTLSNNTNIYYIDLEEKQEKPSTFKTEEEESCMYGKLIISDGKLYVRKVNEKQIEVWALNE